MYVGRNILCRRYVTFAERSTFHFENPLKIKYDYKLRKVNIKACVNALSKPNANKIIIVVHFITIKESFSCESI